MLWWVITAAVALIVGVMVYGSATIGSGIYIRALCRGKKTGRAVALTYDDGPHPERTPEVLDVLSRFGAKAAFFVKGENAEKYPEIVERTAAEGHMVGNHSYSHSGKFPLFGSKRMTWDIERCSRAVGRATGNRPAYFRPPFGVTNPLIARVVKNAGLRVCGWSIRSFDTLGTPREKVLKRIVRKLHDGAIILLHDDRQGCAALTEMLLRELDRRNYRVVRPDIFEK